MATNLAPIDDGRQIQALPEIVKFRGQLEQRANELKMALPSHISPEKFQRTIITAVQGDPSLLDADRQSLILACMRAAQDGLMPDKREAAIVVFVENKKVDGGWQKRKVATYLPMVYGLRKKILQSGDVTALEVGIVYRKELEGGDFYYRVGVEPPLGHKPSFDLTMDDTTDDKIVAAYSIATMKDGTKSYEVMRRFEIDKVREASMTGATKTKRGEPRNPSGPWVDWFPEQAKKTVMRRHSKVLPMSGDLIVDVEGRELDSGMSTAALLAAPAVAPALIEDRGNPSHDAETGEIHEDSALQADSEQQNGDQAEPEPAIEVKAKEAAPVQDPADPGPQPDPAAEPETDVEDDGQSPAEKAAASWIEAFEKASTIIDLKKLYKLSEGDRGAMDETVREPVEAAYDAAEAKLKGGK